MRNKGINHYEKAFGNWLIDNRVHCIAVDEAKRLAMGAGSIKSFDFLLYPPGQNIIVAEVKGRKFKGTSLAGLSGAVAFAVGPNVYYDMYREVYEMRTNIVLDDALVEEAFKYSEAKTKKDLIHEALSEYVVNRSRMDVRNLRGKIAFREDYDYKKLRRRS